MPMKEFCKRCPQLALCIVEHDSPVLDNDTFYPQRQVDLCTDTEEVVRCYPPRNTSEPVGHNGVYGDILRVRNRRLKRSV